MILPILQYGDPILRAKGERVEKIDERVRGAGGEHDRDDARRRTASSLAAQQVGQPLQLTVLDISAVEDRPARQAQWQRCQSEERDPDRANQPGSRGARRNRSGRGRLLKLSRDHR